MIFRTVY